MMLKWVEEKNKEWYLFSLSLKKIFLFIFISIDEILVYKIIKLTLNFKYNLF